MNAFFFSATHKHSCNFEYKWVFKFIHILYNIDLKVQVAMSINTILTLDLYSHSFRLITLEKYLQYLMINDSNKSNHS